jgi:hypothetical protein
VNRTILTSASSVVTLLAASAPANALLFDLSTSSIDFGNVLVGTDSAGEGVFATRTSAGSGSGNRVTVTFPTLSSPFSRTGALTSNLLSNGATSATRVVTFTPTSRGAVTSDWTITGTRVNSPSSASSIVALSGKGVAPVVSVSTIDAVARAGGASGAATIGIANVGDGNLSSQPSSVSNLKGTVGGVSPSNPFNGSGGAINLGDSTSQAFSFTYAPTARGTDLATVTVSTDNGNADGTNTASTSDITISGQAQGPVYNADLGTNGNTIANGATIGFGSLGGGLLTQHLLVSNITPDTGAQSLTNMTVTASIINDPSGEFSFSLSGFDSQTGSGGVLRSATNGFNIGDIAVQFTSKAGPGTAQLRIQTDENAALGVMGSSIYVYDLIYGAAVPEPGTLMVLGTGLLGLAISRRRRGRAEAALLTARNDPA